MRLFLNPFVALFAFFSLNAWSMDPQHSSDTENRILEQRFFLKLKEFTLPAQSRLSRGNASKFLKHKHGMIKNLKKIDESSQSRGVVEPVNNLIIDFFHPTTRNKPTTSFYKHLNDISAFNDSSKGSIAADARTLLKSLNENIKRDTSSFSVVPPDIYQMFLLFLINLVEERS